MTDSWENEGGYTPTERNSIMPTTTTLSPEARNLLTRTLRWLEEDNHWIASAWAVAENERGDTLEMDEKESLLGEAWRGWEEEREEYDEIKEFYNYKVEYPWNESKIQSACTIGALIVTNKFTQDRVVDEAITKLYNSLPELARGDVYDDLGYPNLEDMEGSIIEFNDNSKNGGGSRAAVLNLFRRALGLDEQ